MTKLYAGEFDREQANTWYLPENPYADNSCAVSIVDGALFISNAGIKQESHTVQFDLGYFVGVDLGGWDGWVKYHPYNSNVLSEAGGILVSNENCMAIVRQNNKKGYLLTGTHFPSTLDAPVGTLYVLL